MTEMLDGRPDSLGIAERLSGDTFWSACPCGTGDGYWGGLAGANARHANWHIQWDRGIPLPSTVFWWDSLAIVTGESSRPEREVAYKLGRLFQRENHYDFPMAPDPRTWRGDLSEVLVAVYHHRAIGGLFTYPTMRIGVWDGSPETTVPFNVELMEPQPRIAGIWVCRGYRRKGVASALVRALSSYADIPAPDLIWGVPFSDAGKALALRIAGERIRIA